MRTRIGMLALSVLVILTGAVKAEAATGPQTYRQRVIAGTAHYRPCVALMATREGRTWYRDMVSDTYDDGKRRTVKEQVHYVRTGCVSLTQGV